MKNQNYFKVLKQKAISISMLMVLSLVIIFLGVFFSAFSVINNIHFFILKASIHGAVLGSLVVYLGFRYYLLVLKLKEEIYKSTSEFSWSNFKKNRRNK